VFDDRVHVLIAEDETIIRLDLRQLLEAEGFVVCAEARDGLEAVELARSERPDVAILDLKMPGLDGVEAARRIYAERPLPIVMLTAYGDRPSVERALGAGVFAYVTKPFRPEDVVAAILTALVRHEELLGARREVGRKEEPIELEVLSPSGRSWPIRLGRLADGTLDISLQNVK
jgi:two-component system, response regulator PdtaR